jgi:exodeoxyribonuclease VII large subunit
MPGIYVVLYPTPVQGEGAGDKIAQAVRAASARMEVDVLIVCRGGGSMEDLWAFNEEIVARAIAECTMPVVSGVGHETDFTIADFVADARAPTPTAAAELVSPNRAELLIRLRALAARLSRDIDRALNERMQHLDFLGKRLVHPGERIDAHIARQQELRLRLQRGAGRLLEQHDARLVKMKASLAHLNPQAVLERGYSIVEKPGGQIVRSAQQIAAGEWLRLTFARGAAQTRVEHIEIPEE